MRTTLQKRVLQSALKLEDVTVSEVIKAIEERIGTETCVISWAIEEAPEDKINVSFYAGIPYMEVLHSISSICNYVLLHAEEKSETGKPHIYLSFLKRLQ